MQFVILFLFLSSPLQASLDLGTFDIKVSHSLPSNMQQDKTGKSKISLDEIIASYRPSLGVENTIKRVKENSMATSRSDSAETAQRIHRAEQASALGDDDQKSDVIEQEEFSEYASFIQSSAKRVLKNFNTKAAKKAVKTEPGAVRVQLFAIGSGRNLKDFSVLDYVDSFNEFRDFGTGTAQLDKKSFSDGILRLGSRDIPEQLYYGKNAYEDESYRIPVLTTEHLAKLGHEDSERAYLLVRLTDNWQDFNSDELPIERIYLSESGEKVSSLKDADYLLFAAERSQVLIFWLTDEAGNTVRYTYPMRRSFVTVIEDFYEKKLMVEKKFFQLADVTGAKTTLEIPRSAYLVETETLERDVYFNTLKATLKNVSKNDHYYIDFGTQMDSSGQIHDYVQLDGKKKDRVIPSAFTLNEAIKNSYLDIKSQGCVLSHYLNDTVFDTKKSLFADGDEIDVQHFFLAEDGKFYDLPPSSLKTIFVFYYSDRPGLLETQIKTQNGWKYHSVFCFNNSIIHF